MQRLAALFISILTFSSCLAGKPVTVPIAFDSGAPVVTLKFNGKAIPFLLDTGSSKTFHLANDQAKRLSGLIHTGKQFKSMDATGRAQENDEVKIPRLSVNGLAFGEATGLILKPWGLSIGKGHRPNENMSVLGLGFFDGKQVVIDYPAKTLTIADADDAPLVQEASGWTPYPYERSKAGQVLVFSSGKATYRMILDSPSNISVVKAALAESRDTATPCDINLGPGRTCRSIGLSLPGGDPMKTLLFDLPDAIPDDGMVGQDFFFQYAVFIDSKNSRIMLRHKS